MAPSTARNIKPQFHAGGTLVPCKTQDGVIVKASVSLPMACQYLNYLTIRERENYGEIVDWLAGQGSAFSLKHIPTTGPKSIVGSKLDAIAVGLHVCSTIGRCRAL